MTQEVGWGRTQKHDRAWGQKHDVPYVDISTYMETVIIIVVAIVMAEKSL